MTRWGGGVKVTAPDGSVSQTADHGLTVSNALGSDRYPIGLSAQLDHRVWLGNLDSNQDKQSQSHLSSIQETPVPQS
jgi:hypothetical protein